MLFTSANARGKTCGEVVVKIAGQEVKVTIAG